MNLCPFDTLDGLAWINPVHVVSVRSNPVDPERTDQPRSIIYTVNGGSIYLMPAAVDVVQKLINWSRPT